MDCSVEQNVYESWASTNVRITWQWQSIVPYWTLHPSVTKIYLFHSKTLGAKRFLNLVVDIYYDPLDGGSAPSKVSYTDKNTHTFAATIQVCEKYTGVHVQAEGPATGVRPASDYVIISLCHYVIMSYDIRLSIILITLQIPCQTFFDGLFFESINYR